MHHAAVLHNFALTFDSTVLALRCLKPSHPIHTLPGGVVFRLQRAFAAADETLILKDISIKDNNKHHTDEPGAPPYRTLPDLASLQDCNSPKVLRALRTRTSQGAIAGAFQPHQQRARCCNAGHARGLPGPGISADSSNFTYTEAWKSCACYT